MLGTPTTNYSLAELQVLVASNDVDKVKQYLGKYMAKTMTPPGVYIWTPSQRNFVWHSCKDVTAILLPKSIEMHQGQLKFKPNDWFFSIGNPSTYQTTVAVRKPRVYTENGQGYINLFAGFLHQELQPFDSYSAAQKAAVKTVLDHLYKVWASDNAEVMTYLVQWFARMASGLKNDTVLYLQSGQGTGKSCIAEFLQQKVLGSEIVLITDDTGVVMGSFNSQLQGKVMCVLEEPPAHNAREWMTMSNALKQKVTGHTLDLKEKYRPTVCVPNTVSWMVSTNHNAVKIEADDRRFVMLDVSDRYVGDHAYFDKLFQAMELEGCGEAFAAYLAQQRDPKWAPRKIPNTERKAACRVDALAPLYNWLKERFLVPKVDLQDAFAGIYESYVNWHRMNARSIPPTKQAVSKLLRQANPEWQAVRKFFKGRDGKGNTKFVLKIAYSDMLATFRAKGWVSEFDDIEPAPA